MNRHSVYLDMLFNEIIYLPGRTRRLEELVQPDIPQMAPLSKITIALASDNVSIIESFPSKQASDQGLKSDETSIPKQYHILKRSQKSSIKSSKKKKKKRKRKRTENCSTQEVSEVVEENLDIAPIGAAAYHQ